MKKILLSIIYPLWFFVSQTWLGNMFLIPLFIGPVPLLLFLIFPELATTTGEEAQGLAGGAVILAFLCLPFVGMFIIGIHDYLEEHYKKWNYPTKFISDE